jgi:pimeloyl-ACP methyl ester carboxylesterase
MHVVLIVLAVLLAALAAGAIVSTLIARKVTQAFPPTGQFVEVDGERLHYRSLGDGPPLVLVHGLAGQMRNFEYLPLGEMAKRWRLILIDRPGSGLSPRVDARQAGIGAQARLVASFIRALGLLQRPLLVGHSLGGAIALSVALQDPEAIAGLALIAPLTQFSPDVPAPFRALAIRTPWVRKLFGHTWAIPLGILNSRRTLGFVFGPDAAPADFPIRGGGLLGLRPSAFEAASQDMLAVEDDLPALQERYPELRLPVRVLYGEGDQVLDWRVQGEALQAKVPQVQLSVIAGGHMLPVTQAAATGAWLEEAAGAMLR